MDLAAIGGGVPISLFVVTPIVYEGFVLLLLVSLLVLQAFCCDRERWLLYFDCAKETKSATMNFFRKIKISL